MCICIIWYLSQLDTKLTNDEAYVLSWMMYRFVVLAKQFMTDIFSFPFRSKFRDTHFQIYP